MSANTAVYDRMTAWEMVEYFGRLYGIDNDDLAARMEHLFLRRVRLAAHQARLLRRPRRESRRPWEPQSRRPQAAGLAVHRLRARGPPRRSDRA